MKKISIWLIPCLCSLSIGLAIFYFQDTLLKILFGSSGLAFLIKFSLDFLAKILLQKDDQMFQVGFTSHMADTIFDKHAEFSEKYSEKIMNTVLHLFAEGPSEKALEYGRELRDLRFKYAIWIPGDIFKKLDEGIESQIRKMGAGASVLPHLEVGEQRSKIVWENHELLLRTINAGPDEENKNNLSSYVDLLEYLRNILNVDKLTKLRDNIVNEASKM